MSGVLAQAGWAAGTSWSQAHQTETAKLRILSESMTETYDKLRSAALLGYASPHEFENGHLMVTGEVVVELCYDGDGIIEYCMGAVSSRTYTLTAQLSKVFHMTIDRVTKVYKFAGCKVNSFTIAGQVGEEPVKLTLNITARSVTVANAGTFAALAAPGAPVLFPHLLASAVSGLWLGDQADSLAAGDALPVKSFELSCDNALQADAKDSSDPAYVLEPLRNGTRPITLKLGLARYLATAPTTSLRGWKTAGTRLQAILVLASGSDSYTMYLPDIKITEGADFNVGGPAMIEGAVTLEAYRNLHNTPLAAVTDQLQITAA